MLVRKCPSRNYSGKKPRINTDQHGWERELPQLAAATSSQVLRVGTTRIASPFSIRTTIPQVFVFPARSWPQKGSKSSKILSPSRVCLLCLFAAILFGCGSAALGASVSIRGFNSTFQAEPERRSRTGRGVDPGRITATEEPKRRAGGISSWPGNSQSPRGGARLVSPRLPDSARWSAGLCRERSGSPRAPNAGAIRGVSSDQNGGSFSTRRKAGQSFLPAEFQDTPN